MMYIHKSITYDDESSLKGQESCHCQAHDFCSCPNNTSSCLVNTDNITPSRMPGCCRYCAGVASEDSLHLTRGYVPDMETSLPSPTNHIISTGTETYSAPVTANMEAISSQSTQYCSITSQIQNLYFVISGANSQLGFIFRQVQ